MSDFSTQSVAYVGRAPVTVIPQLFEQVTYSFAGVEYGSSNPASIADGSSDFTVEGAQVLSGEQQFGPAVLLEASAVEAAGVEITVPDPVPSAAPTGLYARGYPRVLSSESQGLTDFPEVFDEVYLRLGSRFKAQSLQNAGRSSNWVLYMPPDSTSQYNSTAWNGTGSSWFTHGPSFTTFGDTTIGGAPNNAATPRQLWLGHLMPSAKVGFLTASVPASNGSQVYQVNDASLFIDDTNTDEAGVWIWTERAPNTTFAQERATPVGSFQDAEYRLITAVDVGANTITTQAAVTPGGTNVGPKLAHAANVTRLMVAPSSQGGQKDWNWPFNIARNGPQDASGKDYPTFFADWHWDFERIDSTGATHSLVWSGLAYDVSEANPNTTSDPDYSGSDTSPGDNGYIGNFNIHYDGFKYITELLTDPARFGNLGVVSGGVKEPYYLDHSTATPFVGQQIEFIGSGGQQQADQNTAMSRWMAEYHRTLRGMALSSEPWRTHVLSKIDTSTQSDQWNTEWATASHAGASHAIMNRSSDPDQHRFYQVLALDANYVGIPSTDPNIATQVAQRGWMGQPNVLGQILGDVSGFIPANERSNMTFTANDEGWQLGSGSATVTHNAGAGRLEVSNINKAFEYQSLDINSPPILGATAGQDHIFMLDFEAESSSILRVNWGQSHFIEYDVGPGRHVMPWVIRVTAGDLGNTFRQRLRVHVPRVNSASDQSQGRFFVNSVRSWSGTNIDPFVIGSTYDNAVVLTNATRAAQTITAPAGEQWKVPDVSDGSVPSWLTPGAVLTSVTMPATVNGFVKSATLGRIIATPTYIEDDFGAIAGAHSSNPTVTFDGANSDNVIVCGPAGIGADYGPFMAKDGVLITPTVVSVANC